MGVEKEVITAGTGPKPVPGQSVTVHCTGYGYSLSLSSQYEKMVIFLRSSGARRTQGSSHSPLKLAKVLLLKDGMKALWECRLEKLLGYGALLTMLMVLVDSQHGVFSPTRFWFLRSKF
ncbi:hypothetical protein CsSME_00048119 [Camellia sinensis var. sinensis]